VRLWGAYSLSGILVTVVVTTAGWYAAPALGRWIAERPAGLPALLVAGAMALLVLSLTLWLEHNALRIAWRARTSDRLQVDRLAPPSAIAGGRGTSDPLEAVFAQMARIPLLRGVAQDWMDAELGTKTSRPMLILILAAVLGWALGTRIAGPVLGAALAISLPLAPRAWIAGRASAARRRFGEQLPSLLDSLASGMAAGLSLQQAVAFAAEEMPTPASAAMQTLSRRLALGHPFEQAMDSLLAVYSEESFGMVVEAISLQRRFGGDLVRMLSEAGTRLRERVELEQEVRAVTAQGRLSGWVLAALVPVSAGMLLASNPRYIDVLFDTWIGQLLLVFSLALMLAGWAVISRLVRVSY
jgi:tight adherence protein B